MNVYEAKTHLSKLIDRAMAGEDIVIGALPPHHADPFDRMLVAQARLENLTLVTRDDRLGDYGIPHLRA